MAEGMGMANATGMRIAALQAPVLDSPQARIDWLATYLPQARADGAHLVALPELFAHGYHIAERLADRAEPRDGPTATAMAELARANGVAVLYGYAERADGVIYNSAACVDAQGRIIGHHRKLAIPPGFERSIFTPGQGVRVFTLHGVRIAILICYDAEFPETARYAASLGAQVIVVPTALGAAWGWVAGRMIPTRGFENGVYLAYINHAGTENGLDYLGQSIIVAPDGEDMARAGAGPEMIVADIHVARVAAAQARLPYLSDREALVLE